MAQRLLPSRGSSILIFVTFVIFITSFFQDRKVPQPPLAVPIKIALDHDRHVGHTSFEQRVHDSSFPTSPSLSDSVRLHVNLIIIDNNIIFPIGANRSIISQPADIFAKAIHKLARALGQVASRSQVLLILLILVLALVLSRANLLDDVIFFPLIIIIIIIIAIVQFEWFILVNVVDIICCCCCYCYCCCC